MDKRKNNLYTRGYFIKRLREGGICAVPLLRFDDGTSKKWTAECQNAAGKKLCVTCFKEASDDFYFKIEHDKASLIVKTMSMDVMINEIRQLMAGQHG